MNKANFNDMFKSILIILLFIIIIGLIWITTNPKLIKDMICSKCNLEGFTSNNTINECNKCYITPFNVSSDNSRLENILNRNINQHNFYFIDNINNYLFTIWKHDTRFNENCTTEEEMNRNRPCCLTDDTLDYEVNQSNFYKSNYIDITLDNTRIGKFGRGSNRNNPFDRQEINFLKKVRGRLPNDYNSIMSNITKMNDGQQTRNETIENVEKIFGKVNKDLFETFKVLVSAQIKEKIYGILFQVNISSELINKNTRKFTFDYIPIKKKETRRLMNLEINDNFSFTYNTDINDESLNIRLDKLIEEKSRNNLENHSINNPDLSNQNKITKRITCNGIIENIPRGDPNMIENCVTKIPLDKARQNQLCWQQGNNIGDKCKLTDINPDCRIFLPKDGVDITGYDRNTGDSNVIDPASNNGNISTPELRSVLQEAADRLVQKFSDRISTINVFNPGFSGIEFPNIGNPTYLNIGRCNSNSPYVFNSGCRDNDNDNNVRTSGGFLYKYKCRPSLTNQFEVCGPLGYSARPDFS